MTFKTDKSQGLVEHPPTLTATQARGSLFSTSKKNQIFPHLRIRNPIRTRGRVFNLFLNLELETPCWVSCCENVDRTPATKSSVHLFHTVTVKACIGLQHAGEVHNIAHNAAQVLKTKTALKKTSGKKKKLSAHGGRQ